MVSINFPVFKLFQLTHGFGCAAHQTSWETLYTTIHESILLLDNCYPQFFGNMVRFLEGYTEETSKFLGNFFLYNATKFWSSNGNYA
jgi:hypothetical protein